MDHVLASIRRLISQNDQRGQGHDAQSGMEDGRAAVRPGSASRSLAGDRLLLTPSLRVPASDARHTGESAPAIYATERGRDGDVHPSSEPGEKPPGPAQTTLEADAGERAQDDAVSHANETANQTPVLRLDDTLRLSDDEAERRDTSSSASKSINLDRKPDAREPAPARATVAFETEHVGDQSRIRNRRTSRPPANSALEAKIAALEAAIARTDDNWEPDAAGGDAYAASRSPAMDWNQPSEPARPIQPDAPYRLEPAARRDLPQVREAAAAGAVASLSDLVDDDTLREIVADIVRQELRGAMGDRITRNVRKLVRREILHALESRDLD